MLSRNLTLFVTLLAFTLCFQKTSASPRNLKKRELRISCGKMQENALQKGMEQAVKMLKITTDRLSAVANNIENDLPWEIYSWQPIRVTTLRTFSNLMDGSLAAAFYPLTGEQGGSVGQKSQALEASVARMRNIAKRANTLRMYLEQYNEETHSVNFQIICGLNWLTRWVHGQPVKDMLHEGYDNRATVPYGSQLVQLPYGYFPNQRDENDPQVPFAYDFQDLGGEFPNVLAIDPEKFKEWRPRMYHAWEYSQIATSVNITRLFNEYPLESLITHYISPQLIEMFSRFKDLTDGEPFKDLPCDAGEKRLHEHPSKISLVEHDSFACVTHMASTPDEAMRRSKNFMFLVIALTFNNIDYSNGRAASPVDLHGKPFRPQNIAKRPAADFLESEGTTHTLRSGKRYRGNEIEADSQGLGSGQVQRRPRVQEAVAVDQEPPNVDPPVQILPEAHGFENLSDPDLEGVFPADEPTTAETGQLPDPELGSQNQTGDWESSLSNWFRSSNLPQSVRDQCEQVVQTEGPNVPSAPGPATAQGSYSAPQRFESNVGQGQDNVPSNAGPTAPQGGLNVPQGAGYATQQGGHNMPPASWSNTYQMGSNLPPGARPGGQQGGLVVIPGAGDIINHGIDNVKSQLTFLIKIASTQNRPALEHCLRIAQFTLRGQQPSVSQPLPQPPGVPGPMEGYLRPVQGQGPIQGSLRPQYYQAGNPAPQSSNYQLPRIFNPPSAPHHFPAGSINPAGADQSMTGNAHGPPNYDGPVLGTPFTYQNPPPNQPPPAPLNNIAQHQASNTFSDPEFEQWLQSMRDSPQGPEAVEPANFPQYSPQQEQAANTDNSPPLSDWLNVPTPPELRTHNLPPPGTQEEYSGAPPQQASQPQQELQQSAFSDPADEQWYRDLIHGLSQESKLPQPTGVT